jgi:hypothetical protein
MASIAPDDALILPHCANPRRMEFSGTTGIKFWVVDASTKVAGETVSKVKLSFGAIPGKEPAFD